MRTGQRQTTRSEAETVKRMGTEAGSVMEVRARRQKGDPLHLVAVLIVSGVLAEDGSGFHVSVHWSREAGLAELEKVKRRNQSLADERGVTPGTGSWLVAVRMFGSGGELVAGPDRSGTIEPGAA